MHLVNVTAFVSIILQIGVTSTNVINGEYIGVIYNVHTHSSYYNETLEDVKIKMGLISNKFKNVFTFGVPTREDNAVNSMYDVNSTNYKSDPRLYSAEAAGLVNKENLSTRRAKGEKKNLKLFIGIHPYDDDNRFITGIQLAIESARRAELHSSHTVQGFVVDFERRSLNISFISMIKKVINASETVHKLNFAIGVRLNCSDISLEVLNSLNWTNKDVSVNLFSFIVCPEYPKRELNGEKAFQYVGDKFGKIRTLVQTFDSRLKVIGQTGLPARSNVKQDIDSIWAFWYAADSWATEEKFHLLMNEAFDNPWSDWNDTTVHEGSYGWWEVQKEATSGRFNLFREKVAVKSCGITNSQNIISICWIYVFSLLIIFITEYSTLKT